MRSMKVLIRNILHKFGYVLWKRDYIRFGVEPLLDIVRLGRAWGQPITTVFDVGANTGQFYREVVAAIPEAVVHSFEPHPTSFSRLSQAVKSPSRCYQVALADRSGTDPFYVYDEAGPDSAINSLTPEAGFAKRAGLKPAVIEVECTTLDEVCVREGVKHIDLLKIDVEGCDLAVLQGGERIFSENRVTFVFVEFNNLLETSGAVGGDLLPIANFLAAYGMRFICSYTDYVTMDRPFWSVSNALFIYDPKMPPQASVGKKA